MTPGNQRRERARATRRRIADAAHRLFATAGYAATTMDSVAAAAGVAVQTVYHVFHTKAALLQEVLQAASAGHAGQHGPSPADQAGTAVQAAQPAWMGEALGAADGRRALALSVEHGVDVGARVAPLVGAISAAASTDPDFAGYWDLVCTARREGTARVVAAIAARGQLRPGLGTRRAADIFYAIGSHETLLAFLVECGWPLEEVKAWYYATLCDQVLSDDARRGLGAQASPTAGLSFDHLAR